MTQFQYLQPKVRDRTLERPHILETGTNGEYLGFASNLSGGLCDEGEGVQTPSLKIIVQQLVH